MTQEAWRARVARLEGIIEITRSLNSTLSRQPLLAQIVEAARELTEAEGGSIMLLDRKTGELHFEAASGERSRELRSVVVPIEGSIAGWVVQHGQPLIIDDARNDARFCVQVDHEVRYETRSLLAVPLAVKGKLIGVLEAVNKRGDRAFSQQDLQTLTIVADQAAVAIENAVLFEQSDLVAEIVHEMRTPLTSIAGYAGIIQREDVSDQQRSEFARKIQQETARLGRMADDFLELARLESGRAFPKREEVSLQNLVQEAVELLRPQAEEKRVVLQIQLPEQLPALTADEQRLHRVLVNLLGNAVKYCRPGDRVTVTARASGQEIQLRVADTGPGIPLEAQQRLFERFYRSASVEGAVEGSGLGLAIARQIVEAHGGRIWVESEQGEGAAFIVALPL